MKLLLCENNFAAFLTAIYHYYYFHKDADGIISDENRVALIDSVISVTTDIELARKVKKGLREKLGVRGYREISDAYLSSNKDKEIILYEFIKLAFAHKYNVYTMFSEPKVIAFSDMLHKVRAEVHRMHGFIRFQEMENGIYYAFFGTDNDILNCLRRIAARFNCQQFVLHDVIRKKMVYYDGERAHLLLAPFDIDISLSEKEALISELWKNTT